MRFTLIFPSSGQKTLEKEAVVLSSQVFHYFPCGRTILTLLYLLHYTILFFTGGHTSSKHQSVAEKRKKRLPSIGAKEEVRYRDRAQLRLTNTIPNFVR